VAYLTAEQSKQRNIGKMGEALGTQYSLLWQEVALLHRNWQQYVELFGTKPSRTRLLNETAPYFYRMLQDDLWDVTLLHIARLTDPPKTGNKENLTIQNFPSLVDDAKTKEMLVALLAVVKNKTEFCRDWRNRYIAHNDLDIALERSTTPLADASRQKVKEALKAIVDVMNAVDFHYFHSETRYDLGGTLGGAMSLIYALHRGAKLQDERMKRLEAGEFNEDDLDPSDL
jgi:hypothetical protein